MVVVNDPKGEQVMNRDIDQVIENVQKRLPAVEVQQLVVSHPVDDDGLWWFRLPGIEKDIQIESPTGMCPFIVEHDDMKSSSEAESARTIDEAVDKILVYLFKQSAHNS